MTAASGVRDSARVRVKMRAGREKKQCVDACERAPDVSRLECGNEWLRPMGNL